MAKYYWIPPAKVVDLQQQGYELPLFGTRMLPVQPLYTRTDGTIVYEYSTYIEGEALLSPEASQAIVALGGLVFEDATAIQEVLDSYPFTLLTEQ